MNPSTVAQSAPARRDDVLSIISDSKNPLSVREIRFHMPRSYTHLVRDIAALVDELVDEGIVDYEQRRSDIKLYFLATKPPRLYMREVPAHAPPPVRAQRKPTWCSMLGGV